MDRDAIQIRKNIARREAEEKHITQVLAIYIGKGFGLQGIRLENVNLVAVAEEVQRGLHVNDITLDKHAPMDHDWGDGTEGQYDSGEPDLNIW